MFETAAEDNPALQEKAINRETLKDLESEAARYSKSGVRLFFLGVVLGAILLAVSYHLTISSIHELNQAKEPPLMLVLLLVRGTFFGALSVGFLYAVFTIATAYIDQAAHFRKRLYSAHMLNYVFATFGDQIKDSTVKMGQVVGVFSAWNENVDSAFSSVRFQRDGKDLSLDGKRMRIAVDEPRKRRRRRRSG